eukprot:XP_011444577.1 PREDICTED: caspase-2 [Crassostrea gigas]
MNKHEWDIIRRNRVFIHKNVSNINEVVDLLYEKGILTLNQKECVASQPVDRRAYEMLDIVVKRGPRAFPCLVEALRETENPAAANQLEGNAGSTTDPNKTKTYTKPDPPNKLPTHHKGVPPSEDNSSYVEWMDDVELTKLEDNFIRTDPKFVMEMKKLHNEHMYNMTGDKSKRGKCLMIDSIPNDFCQQGECHTIVDSSKTLIHQTLKQCGFKCIYYTRNSGTSQTIKQKILQEMNKPDHVQYSSFLVICVTTGPNPQYIYGKDGEKDCLPIQEIQDMMSQCEAFSNKPKMLMVHTVPESSLKCDHSFPLAEDRDQRLSDSMQYLTLEGKDTSSLNGGDLFVVSVRLEPGISFLVKIRGKTGAYFSNALVYVLLKHAANRSFLEMTKEMDRLFESCEYEGEDSVDANPYNKRVHRRVRVARLTILTKPEKELFLFPQYEDTGTQVSG